MHSIAALSLRLALGADELSRPANRVAVAATDIQVPAVGLQIELFERSTGHGTMPAFHALRPAAPGPVVENGSNLCDGVLGGV